MRSSTKPNLRIQDLTKHRLLCADCEQRFSPHEKYFSETIFKPFLNTNSPVIEYDENLKRFVISILWRVLVFLRPTIHWKSNKHGRAVEKIEREWRGYLFNGTGLCSLQYVVMLKMVPNAKPIEGPLAVDLNWYLFRAADVTVGQTVDDALVYAKIPGFAFFASIYGHRLRFFQNCLVEKKGILDFNTQNVDFMIFRLLQTRADAMGSQLQSLSETQLAKIESDYERFSERIAASYGFQIYAAKQIRNKSKK
jgi:hypothetical protein